MPWTDDMVDSLKKMWDEGLSTGEIGKRLGVSKNSIVGKVHRLQLTARPSPIKKKETAANEKTKEAPVKAKEKKSTVTEEKKTIAPKTEPEAETPKTVKPAPENKPAPQRAPVKEKESMINMSIPVAAAPRKPGDKVTVTDLDNHTCRWPIGDPKDENFHFCGAKVKVGQTYCEEHAAIAYVKAIKK